MTEHLEVGHKQTAIWSSSHTQEDVINDIGGSTIRYEQTSKQDTSGDSKEYFFNENLHYLH